MNYAHVERKETLHALVSDLKTDSEREGGEREKDRESEREESLCLFMNI